VSSTCVVWNGPDIPCIDLCQGDSIESVVHQLATLLCESTTGVIDVTTLDFKCVVDSQTSPDTLLEALQAIIDKVCELEDCCDGNPGTTTPQPITLPACLYYTQNGETVTQLLPAAYSRYLADKICTILTTITTVQSAINSLNSRVTNLENTVGGPGVDPQPITVTTQCASGINPGLTLNINQAFSNFEAKFCQLHSLLGTLAALTAVVNKQCPNLGQSTQLNNSSQIMSQLGGWINTPVTISDTLNNLWLTVCDMRAAIVSQGSGNLACALVPVSNVQIVNCTTTGCTISWTPPTTTGTESPAGYTVTVTEWNGSATVGSAIVTTSVNHPTNNVVFGTIGNPNTFYKVEVKAAYSCGDSIAANTIGKLALSTVQYYLRVTDVITSGNSTTNCAGQAYPAVQKTTTIELINPLTNTAVINTGPNITATLRFNVTHDCAPSPIEDVVLTILSGQSSGTYTYYGEQSKACGQDPCTTEYKIFSCGVSINTNTVVFAPTVPSC
jgi:hypothetical protein